MHTQATSCCDGRAASPGLPEKVAPVDPRRRGRLLLVGGGCGRGRRRRAAGWRVGLRLGALALLLLLLLLRRRRRRQRLLLPVLVLLVRARRVLRRAAVGAPAGALVGCVAPVEAAAAAGAGGQGVSRPAAGRVVIGVPGAEVVVSRGAAAGLFVGRLVVGGAYASCLIGVDSQWDERYPHQPSRHQRLDAITSRGPP